MFLDNFHVYPFHLLGNPFRYSILSGDRVVLGEVGLVVAVTDSVERGKECEGADRVTEGLAREAHRWFLLVYYLNTN